jgi:DNA-binding PadR family transcriptional regulator
LNTEQLLQKWQTEYKKGFSKPLILFALANLKESYPFKISNTISTLTKGQISIIGSNIYPMLTKLKEEGLIESEKDKNERYLYKLTIEGNKFLNELDLSIKEFFEMIDNIKAAKSENIK